MVLLVLVLMLAGAASAQDPAGASFDDLSRRAEAALDTQPAEAVGLYKRALAAKQDWAEGWFSLGGALFQLNRYAEATHAFRRGLELVPDRGAAWAFLGLCEAALRNDEQALADIQKGEQIGLAGNPQFEVAVRVQAARILVRSSSFDDALRELFPLSMLKQDYPAVVETMGLCALSIPQSIEQVPPQRREVVTVAGRAAWALAGQRGEESAAAYKELLERFPNEPGVHYANGLYKLESDRAVALSEFQKEVRNNPSHWPAWIVIATLQTRAGAPEAGIEAARNALKYAPGNYHWLCHAELGRAYMTSDQLESATKEFEAAVRQRPSSAQVHYFLAQAYRRAGKAAEAKRETELFRELASREDPLAMPGPAGAVQRQ